MVECVNLEFPGLQEFLVEGSVVLGDECHELVENSDILAGIGPINGQEVFREPGDGGRKNLSYNTIYFEALSNK